MGRKVHQVFFSPGGTTSRTGAQLASGLDGEKGEGFDLLRNKAGREKIFDSQDVVVVSLPVFAGRVPQICLPELKKLRGNGTAAVALVVYGNRAYEDALLELTDLLEAQGFWVAGAGAFIARHSIFPRVAEGRPDEKDSRAIGELAKAVQSKLDSGTPVEIAGRIPGGRPYREAARVPMVPIATSACTRCGVCAALCPAGAINAASPNQTDAAKCICCTACIYGCKEGARKFGGVKYWLGKRMFRKKYSARLEPEWFA